MTAVTELLAQSWQFAREIVPDLPNDVAHDWFGLATWALICCAFVLIARGYFKLKRGIDATVANVQNGHRDPLRADVDKILVAVGEIQSALAAETAARKTGIDGVTDRLGGIEEHLRKG